MTRTFDLSVEGESASEVEQLLVMVEKRGIMSAQGSNAGIPLPGAAMSKPRQSETIAHIFPGPSPLDAPDTQRGPSTPFESAEGRERQLNVQCRSESEDG